MKDKKVSLDENVDKTEQHDLLTKKPKGIGGSKSTIQIRLAAKWHSKVRSLSHELNKPMSKVLSQICGTYFKNNTQN